MTATEGKVSNTVHGTVEGTVVQVGTVQGDINLHTGQPVRTRYLEQVKRIAPAELLDREPELAELAEFCTGPDAAGAYAWWRGDAWSGKSALMATFVLSPPPGVRIVSFFVTARLSGQNDRAAFIENLVEQLLTLLDQSMPPFLTESTREAHLLGLLGDAAEACEKRGEQFVLLVDGLDEDRGVSTDLDSYSIAALLPLEPPFGMRVVVAGRENPPIPGDVHEHHPLRRPAVVRRLTPSSRAKAIRNEMERELQRLLSGNQIEQDVLGLTAAAGGGLTATDLSELTGESPWLINRYMRAVTGRSFTRRDSHYLPGTAPDVYLLGHEELQVTALEILGPDKIAKYRERLHAWALHHRGTGWQGDVPEYLLRGYFGMLTAAGDTTLMVKCASDAIRHDRMLDLSGSDATALAEIAATLDAVAATNEPDLLTMIELAMHRDKLTDRGGDMPVRLPALWAEVGRVNRAETVAKSFKYTRRRIAALIDVVQTIFRNGDVGRARELFDYAQADAMAIADPHEKTQALTDLVHCAAKCDMPNHAASLLDVAESIAGESDLRKDARLALVRATFASGDLSRARRAAESIADIHVSVRALTWLARVSEDARAELLSQAETAANTIKGKGQRKQARLVVARTAAELGDLDRAERLNEALKNVSLRNDITKSIVRAAARAGDVDEATRIVEDIRDRGMQVRAWLAAAEVAGPDHGPVFRSRAANSLRDAPHQVLSEDLSLWHSMVTVTAKAGDLDLAEEFSAGISYEKDRALTAIVRGAARAGDSARAARLTRRIAHPSALASAWLAVAKADPTFLGEAEAAVDSEPSLPRRVTNWVMLAKLAAKSHQAGKAAEYLTRSEAVIREIVQPVHLSAELTALAKAAARTGDLTRTRQLVMALQGRYAWVELVRSVVGRVTDCHGLPAADSFLALCDVRLQQEGLIALAELLVYRQDLAEAERVAESVRREDDQTRLLVEIALAAANAGDFGRAEAIWLRHVESWNYDQLLDPLIGSLSGTGVLERMLPLVKDNLLSDVISFQIESSRGRAEYRRIFGESLSVDSERAWARDAALLDSSPILSEQHVLTAKCVALHRAGNTRATQQLLMKLTASRTWLAPYLLEPLVQVMIEAGELDQAESLCRRFGPDNSAKHVIAMVLRAIAEAGDDERVERVLRGVGHADDRAHAAMVIAEFDAGRRRYDRIGKLLGPLFPQYIAHDELMLRLTRIAVGQHDFEQALRSARSGGTPQRQAEALDIVLDGAIAANDLQAAARVAQAHTTPSSRVRAAAMVAQLAGHNDDSATITQMVELVADAEAQATVLVAVSGAPRRKAVANALQLARWHVVVESVVEEQPMAFQAIMSQFEAMQD